MCLCDLGYKSNQVNKIIYVTSELLFGSDRQSTGVKTKS